MNEIVIKFRSLKIVHQFSSLKTYSHFSEQFLFCISDEVGVNYLGPGEFAQVRGPEALPAAGQLRLSRRRHVVAVNGGEERGGNRVLEGVPLGYIQQPPCTIAHCIRDQSDWPFSKFTLSQTVAFCFSDDLTITNWRLLLKPPDEAT